MMLDEYSNPTSNPYQRCKITKMTIIEVNFFQFSNFSKPLQDESTHKRSPK